MRVRAARADDAPALAAIYAPYVSGSAISFETDPPSPSEMLRRMDAGGELYPWLVAEEEGGTVAGYAYAAAFRTRAAYLYAVETSVYLREDVQGRGIGAMLYRPLLAILEAQDFTQAIAAIALPNAPSVSLHERLGFVHAGIYRQVGWKLGRWWDVGLWQRPLAALEAPAGPPRPYAAIGIAPFEA